MTRKEKKYLFDIIQSIDDIHSVHLEGITSEEEFSADLKSIRAIERELAIIGEASYQLQKLGLHFPGQDQAINRRNTLVHQYDAARPANLYNYILFKLPGLKRTLLSLLNKI